MSERSLFKKCDKCGGMIKHPFTSCDEYHIICKKCKQHYDIETEDAVDSAECGSKEYYNQLFSSNSPSCEYDGNILSSHFEYVSECLLDSCECGETSCLEYLIQHFVKHHPEQLMDLSTTGNYFTIDSKHPVALLTQFNKANRFNALYWMVLQSHKGDQFFKIQYIGKTNDQNIKDSLLLKEFTISSEDYPELSLSCKILPILSCEDNLRRLCPKLLINKATNISSLKGDKFKISIADFHLKQLSYSTLLACANCDEILSAPIRMCKKNHSFCNSCNEDMELENKNCSLCDNVIIEERNHNLENLIEALRNKRGAVTA